MKSLKFTAGETLTTEQSGLYVERQADREMIGQLRAMEYILVIEPRQQGKTSLVHHLMRNPGLMEISFGYVDVTTLDPTSEASWYTDLCPRILRQLRRLIPRDKWPALPQTAPRWRDFLCEIATFAVDAGQQIVIALDEIGAVSFSGATEFFSVLRDVYNSREVESELKHLTFILTGAFHPRDLIRDDKVSPFNVAQRARLPDFDPDQTRELVDKGGWSPTQAAALSERIYQWTDGQPYLTQLLCSYLGPDSTTADVDAGVTRLRQEDENHLPPLLDRLGKDDKLREYTGRIHSGEEIRFYPRENRRQAQLELLGVIKTDQQGYCRIRNRIYEQVLREFCSSSTAQSPIISAPADPQDAVSPQQHQSVQPGQDMQEAFRYDAFISRSKQDAEWVSSRLLPRLERDGLRVCVDVRDFEVGVPTVLNTENAIKRSRKTLLVLTPDWVTSEWAEFEALSNAARQCTTHGRPICTSDVRPMCTRDIQPICTRLTVWLPHLRQSFRG